jgi:hypothetical protein
MHRCPDCGMHCHCRAFDDEDPCTHCDKAMSSEEMNREKPPLPRPAECAGREPEASRQANRKHIQL